MATLPTTGDDLDLVSFTVETQPSDTYKLDIEHDRVRGMTDEQDAVRQAIYLILNVERLKDILGEADRQVRGVGVVRRIALLGSGDDVGIALYIVLCEAIGGCRGHRTSPDSRRGGRAYG